MRPLTPLVLTPFLLALVDGPAVASSDGACSIVALTDTTGTAFSDRPSLAGDVIAFGSSADLVGENADGNLEIFVVDLADGAAVRQVTHSSGAGTYNFFADTDGRKVVFESNADLVPGRNADATEEIFLFDLATSELTQLTDASSGDSLNTSVDGDLVSFVSSADLTGGNSDGNLEDFVLHLSDSGLEQITDTAAGSSAGQTSADDGRVAFNHSGDPLGIGATGYNLYLYDDATGTVSKLEGAAGFIPTIAGDRIVYKAGTHEGVDVYLYDLSTSTLTRVTHTPGIDEATPSIDGDWIAFGSQADLLGTNPDGNFELFLYDIGAETLTQVTDSTGGAEQLIPSIAGSRIAFNSNGNPTGGNPDHNTELFLADCSGLIEPPPPAGPWLTSSEIPDFRFKVRIAGPGGSYRAGAKEPGCIGETLCVSGAVSGRSEAFLRVVGPKPNGKLWPTLVKFSTSQIEIWVQQVSSGAPRYYVLEGARPGFDELPGLFDRQGFTPADGLVAQGAEPRFITASRSLNPRADTWSTSPQVPGFRFRVTIDNGVDPPVDAHLEGDCIDETACLSGAVPGRSELFLRVVGPKPNGYLWPTLVKFSTSAIDVWIEQIDSDAQQHYHLEGASPGSDDLTGLFDRTGFLP